MHAKGDDQNLVIYQQKKIRGIIDLAMCLAEIDGGQLLITPKRDTNLTIFCSSFGDHNQAVPLAAYHPSTLTQELHFHAPHDLSPA